MDDPTKKQKQDVSGSMGDQWSGGAPTQSTEATEGAHFDATHEGTEEGGGVQRAELGDLEQNQGSERDHISGGKMGI